jgi:hypothetical protein
MAKIPLIENEKESEFLLKIKEHQSSEIFSFFNQKINKIHSAGFMLRGNLEIPKEFN